MVEEAQRASKCAEVLAGSSVGHVVHDGQSVSPVVGHAVHVGRVGQDRGEPFEGKGASQLVEGRHAEKLEQVVVDRAAAHYTVESNMVADRSWCRSRKWCAKCQSCADPGGQS